MILKKTSLEEFKKSRGRGYGTAQEFVLEFIESEEIVAEVVAGEHEYSDAYSMASIIKNASKSLGHEKTVGTMTREGKTYIFRKDKIDD